MPDWQGDDGRMKHGKTIGIDLSALYELMEQDATVEQFFRDVFHIGQEAGHD
jgi:hypothetical protein